ncbi:Transporter of the ATP-binding cassette (ABC) [Batrachochytrium dendrobatidis]|nr:Transporter of the ATP-binding cassette (ABC) [Batrachochytrium dendrobatidis]KAK5671979.1 Transporter of the ATP-binding cassette (ABC) [Batrachochytrium dendrobatidis]
MSEFMDPQVQMVLASVPAVLLIPTVMYCLRFPILGIDSGYEPIGPVSQNGTGLESSSELALKQYLSKRLRLLNGGLVLAILLGAAAQTASLVMAVNAGMSSSNVWLSLLTQPAVLSKLLAIVSWLAFLGTCPLAIRSNVAFHGGLWSLFFVALGMVAYQTVSIFQAVMDASLASNQWYYLLWSDVTVAINGLLLLLSVGIMFAVGLFSDNSSLILSAKASRENGASVISSLFFFWLNDLISLGNKQFLEQDDLWELIDDDKTALLMDQYNAIKERNPTRSLMYNMTSVVYHHLFFQSSCAILSAVFGFAGPFFLFKIISHIQDPANGPPTQAWYYLISLFACTVAKSLIDGQMYFTGRRVGTRIRSILVAELYTKSLRRAQGASSVDSTSEETDPQASLGKIVTLMSVDTERIRMFVSYFHQMLIGEPLSAIIAIAGLFIVLGWSAFAGVVLIVIISSCATPLGKAIVTIQEKLMANTDKRINVINEMLQGIRIVKYFAWEEYFSAKIAEARAAELLSLFHLWSAWIGFGNIGSGSGLLVAFVTFAVYTLVAGKTLDVATAFTAVNLLHVVSGLLSHLPNEIMQVFKAKVSLDRISEFLKEEELEKYQTVTMPPRSDSDNISDTDTISNCAPVIGFHNGHFSYFSDSSASLATSTNTTSGDDLSKTLAVKNVTEHTPLISSQSTDEASATNPAFVLRDLNIEFPVGGFSVICGSTGSGKSSLISALLGEMRRLQGRNYIPDRCTSADDQTTGTSNGIAYAAQSAWLLNATIRDNILFGEAYDEQRYHQVIVACALVKDLENLEGGDLTEIGEKGINMSGGQKQRIALARACYSHASFVLLDDPLSAVDAPTARHLLKRCILDAMRGRTIVLVSHAVSLVLPHADFVAVVKNGEIVCQGSPTDLTQNVDADGIFGLDLSFDSLANEEDAATATISAAADTAAVTSVMNASAISNGKKLVEDEEKATGSVRAEVYNTYFKAAGGTSYIVLFLLSFLLVSGATLANDWWLKIWTDQSTTAAIAASSSANSSFSSLGSLSSSIGGVDSDLGFAEMQHNSKFVMLSVQSVWSALGQESSASASNPTAAFTTFSAIPEPASPALTQKDAIFYVGVYALFGLGVILANNIQLIIILWGSFVASRRMHDTLLASVLGSPLRFFEVTPIGRILNRFSKDIENIDSSVMESIEFFVAKVIQGGTIVCVIGVITPPFLIIVLPVVFLYLVVARMYLNTSRELKRLESVSRSPIYAQFSETLTGVSTIRAYGAEDRFSTDNNEKVDLNHRSFFFIWAANRWLCLRTELISAAVVLFAGLAVIFGNIGAGWAALTITYALDFTNALLWTVRMHAEMEMSMNSVERVKEYTGIEQEPPAIIESNRPDPSWPAEGSIVVKDLSIRYAAEQPDVLKKLNFTVKGAEKVAVVGRTGAGKSTLSLAFFRIIPLSGGSIEIDGVDIGEIGLFDLRSRLTIIPQDPVLFTGNLRTNLDPLGEHDDASLWMALRRVHFLDSLQQPQSSTATLIQSPSSSSSMVDLDDSTSTVMAPSSVPTASTITLEYPVNENGGNFSQGQRQLLCLARALLRSTRVIFLDEATASVDNDTDTKIQQTIRQEFAHGTVICIAHRLRTIIDYDKVLVLDHGKVLEYGSPISLIETSPIAAFRKMCEETGEFDELVRLAREAENKRLSVDHN